ncbi:hypothetical protein D9M68_915190 [compost metagenome]
MGGEKSGHDADEEAHGDGADDIDQQRRKRKAHGPEATDEAGKAVTSHGAERTAGADKQNAVHGGSNLWQE